MFLSARVLLCRLSKRACIFLNQGGVLTLLDLSRLQIALKTGPFLHIFTPQVSDRGKGKQMNSTLKNQSKKKKATKTNTQYNTRLKTQIFSWGVFHCYDRHFQSDIVLI